MPQKIIASSVIRTRYLADSLEAEEKTMSVSADPDRREKDHPLERFSDVSSGSRVVVTARVRVGKAAAKRHGDAVAFGLCRRDAGCLAASTPGDPSVTSTYECSLAALAVMCRRWRVNKLSQPRFSHRSELARALAGRSHGPCRSAGAAADLGRPNARCTLGSGNVAGSHGVRGDTAAGGRLSRRRLSRRSEPRGEVTATRCQSIAELWQSLIS